MDYQRGDRVQVRGYGGREAVLRVWELRDGGLLLCTESGFLGLQRGKDEPLVGFPLTDIVGKVTP